MFHYFQLVLLFGVLSAVWTRDPIVHIEAGAIQGSYGLTPQGQKFSSFKGIPYARPPIGKYRFKEPAPIKKWPGVWNALEYGSSCLQYDISYSDNITGTEDCLYLNVFTPKLFVMEMSALLEVLVIINGNTFMTASPIKYDPVLMMDGNVVIVTFNYRLGVFGFLSTEDDVVPGNNGLKDQTLVLQWVQQNIAAFGGNPSKVTIAGSLAGAASVHYHYFSPLSQGLFRGGLSFGATALSPWAHVQEPQRQAVKLAQLMGCSTYTSRDLVDCLRYRPARGIIRQIKHFLVEDKNSHFGMIPINAFGPTVEKMGNSPFINKYPGDCFLTGAVQDLPWVVSLETSFGLPPITVTNMTLEVLERHFTTFAPVVLLYNSTAASEQHGIISGYIYQSYVANKSSIQEKLQGFDEMIRDRLYTVDVERSVRLMASTNVAPVYLFSVSNNTLNRGMTEQKGIKITDENEFLTSTKNTISCTSEEKSLLHLLSEIYINFVKTGNPTPSNFSTNWLPLVPNYKTLQYLDIFDGTKMNLQTRLELGKRKFWDSLPLQDSSSIAFKVKMFSHAAEL